MSGAREVRFEAMGTACHISLDGGPPLAAATGRARVVEIERRWSRFIPESDISRLNRALGNPIEVSVDTLRLLETAISAWRATEGRYDPTVIDSLTALGYDWSFGARGFGDSSGTARPAPGCEGIEIDETDRTVRLPLGVRLDAGGIGKGLAADIVSEEMWESGAEQVLVNLGGDVRVFGAPVCVVVHEPASGAYPCEIVLEDGALATSTTLRRRWTTREGPVHHVIDPSTGKSTDGPRTVATAIAGTAWWAEALTISLLVGGSGAGLGAPWRLVHEDGSVRTGGAFDTYVRTGVPHE